LSAEASGSFHGFDQFDQKVYVRIKPFRLDIPDTSKTEPPLS